MAIIVEWSDEAKSTFAANIAYLKEDWTDKEIQKFILRTQYVVLKIEENPETYTFSKKSNKVRKAIINKRITLYYRYFPKKKIAILLAFWNNYQHPKRLKF